MTSAAATALPAPPVPPAHRPSANQAPSLTRLTGVELRKMSDTRAGWWLELSVLTIMVITVTATCAAGHPQQRTFQHILSNALIPAAILLPVVGMLLITSEWSQRTTLTTFTLVPRRSRVLVAKLLAATTISVIPFAFGVAISAAGAAVSPSGVHGAWTLHGAVLAQGLIYLVTNMMIGVAFGTALFASAPAIVAYFAFRALEGSEADAWLAAAYLGLGDIKRARSHLAIATENSTTRTEHDLYAAKLDRISSHSAR